MRPTDLPYVIFSLALSVIALLIVSLDNFGELSGEAVQVLVYADLAVCALFFADFCVSLARAENRLQYMARWGWLDLLSCIPNVDALRWARLGRVVRIVVVLRALRSMRVLYQFLSERRAQSALLVAALTCLALLVSSSIAVLHFEQGPEGNIRSAQDAVWWSLSTLSTVGYGDRFPVTTEGRMVAAVLMTAGVGAFATLSGALAAWFVRPQAGGIEIELMREELAKLRAAVESLQLSSVAKRQPETPPEL